MKSNAPKSIDQRERALGLSRLLVLTFEDPTDLTYADLEQALTAIHDLKRCIRAIKAGDGVDLPDAGPDVTPKGCLTTWPVSLSLRLQE